MGSCPDTDIDPAHLCGYFVSFNSKEMQFNHQTAKLEGYLMLNMNLSNYNLIKYQSSMDFYFINTKVQKEKAFQTSKPRQIESCLLRSVYPYKVDIFLSR